MKIIGNTVGMGLPKPNMMQGDPSKGDYVKNRTHWEEGSIGTIEWNGSTMGRRTIELMEGTFYKISDVCPTAEEIMAGTIEYNDGQTSKVTSVTFSGFTDGQAKIGSYLYAINTPTVIEGNVLDNGAVGVYGRISGETYPAKFTYGSITVHQLDEKYIPETIARTKDIGTSGLPLPPAAVVGQYIVVAAVDESGKVTATEAVDAPAGEVLTDAEGVAF